MKKILSIVLLLTPTILFSQQMNIISFNIRYNTPNDGVNAWPNRIEMVTGLLRLHGIDIFGLERLGCLNMQLYPILQTTGFRQTTCPCLLKYN